MFKCKFEKSKYPVVKISFWLIIFFALLSIFVAFISDKYHFSASGLNYPLETIKITLETTEKIDNTNFSICYNDYCETPETNAFYSYYASEYVPAKTDFFKKPVKKISVIYPFQNKDFRNLIENIDVHVGMKNYYYSQKDIKNFEVKNVNVELLDSKDTKKFSALILPEINNYKGLKSHISIFLLSLADNWFIFISSYFWLFCAYLIYVFNKDEFNFKLSDKTLYLIFGAIALLGLFLRWSDIAYYPLWTDEIYTKAVAIENFASCFKDPGNPPLFFILEYLFTRIFPASNLTLRFLPFLFGVLFIPGVFLLFKDINKKLALFGAFFASINLINIYHSQEARGYSLCMLLGVILIYLLFRYLKNPSIKNLIFYAIAALFAINTNYYLVLFVFSNFIWAIADLLENKELKNKKKIFLSFFAANFICALSFIPYLIISSKTALNDSFNTWIPEISSETFLYTINAYFINKYVFLALSVVLLANLILCFAPKNILEKFNLKINPDKENLFIFLIYSLAFILILASAISIFIKPIIHKRVLLSLYSLLFLLEIVSIASVIDFIKFNKIAHCTKTFYSVVLVFVCFAITKPMPLREIYNVQDFINFIQNDAPKYASEYEIHAITCDSKEYLRAYPEILKLDYIKWHFLDTNSGKVLKKIKKSNYTTKDKAIIYFNSIGVDTQNVEQFNPFLRVHRSNLTTGAKIIYD